MLDLSGWGRWRHRWRRRRQVTTAAASWAAPHPVLDALVAWSCWNGLGRARDPGGASRMGFQRPTFIAGAIGLGVGGQQHLAGAAGPLSMPEGGGLAHSALGRKTRESVRVEGRLNVPPIPRRSTQALSHGAGRTPLLIALCTASTTLSWTAISESLLNLHTYNRIIPPPAARHRSPSHSHGARLNSNRSNKRCFRSK